MKNERGAGSDRRLADLGARSTGQFGRTHRRSLRVLTTASQAPPQRRLADLGARSTGQFGRTHVALFLRAGVESGRRGKAAQCLPATEARL
jgi:hypothetical protein